MGDSNKINTGNNTGPYGLLGQFLGWKAERKNQFTQNDPYTQSLRQHPAVKRVVEQAGFDVSLDCYETCGSKASGKVDYNLGKYSIISNVSDFLRTMLGAATFGLVGKNPDYGVIGSFSGDSKWSVQDVSCQDGTATIDMHVENSMSAPSLTRYSYSSPDSTVLPENPFGETAPLATTKQSWDWEEKVSFPPAQGCDNNGEK